MTSTTTAIDSNKNSDDDTTQLSFEVIIVGAGVAGSSAAYHLHHTGHVSSLLVLDAGPAAGQGVAPRHSGSATMDDTVAPCIKMMVQLFSTKCQDMIKHHGKDGAARCLRATEKGLVLQKSIAQEIWQDQAKLHLKEYGSYYVGYPAEEEELQQEFKTLQELECHGIVWCDKARLQTVEGMSPNFSCGIFFPKDAVIDSSLYSKTLLQYVLDKCHGQAQFWPNSSVQQVQETKEGVMVELASGKQLRAKHVVMATGALYQDPKLHGLITPCYSYLVHVPIDTNYNGNNKCEHSANFFTWGFSHDWCFTNGKVRISGEDHFCAYKPPHLQERCARLSQWTLEQYHCNPDTVNLDDLPQQYGLYSETPDLVPLVGRLTSTSRVCYLLGCNAWGQTVLSYCSSLVPGLMQYAELSEEQQDSLKLFSIQRFSQLPAALVE